MILAGLSLAQKNRENERTMTENVLLQANKITPANIPQKVFVLCVALYVRYLLNTRSINKQTATFFWCTNGRIPVRETHDKGRGKRV